MEFEELRRLEQVATQVRLQIMNMIYEAQTGHTGSSLGETDILVSLYFGGILRVDPKQPDWEGRDRFILSKGHAVEAYYATLAQMGFFDPDLLKTYCHYGSPFIGHPNNKIPGVEMNTGALGHGLAIGVGMALAGRLSEPDSKSRYRVFVLMGDGELAEGSVWEAAMAASHYQLDNLVAIVDRNRLQISGSTENVMSLEPLHSKWESFGWDVREIDGHDYRGLIDTFASVPFSKSRPSLVIANTIKGKGISFAENRAGWHHHVPTEEEYLRALDELNALLGGGAQ
ncbi:transketolase [Alicyclobacillus vulcanalis]|uniref:Transketolase n=1 Tax=Alicyclobacillus vulcanalis TaxID=252246 RepID=A0A1N7PGJ5_9BACL|nr:transketolase [Alicyclobacillus vulcanalis]SIT09656.1 transketolase [Alicyclobacillus vulcanalis]